MIWILHLNKLVSNISRIRCKNSFWENFQEQLDNLTAEKSQASEMQCPDSSFVTEKPYSFVKLGSGKSSTLQGTTVYSTLGSPLENHGLTSLHVWVAGTRWKPGHGSMRHLTKQLSIASARVAELELQMMKNNSAKAGWVAYYRPRWHI